MKRLVVPVAVFLSAGFSNPAVSAPTETTIPPEASQTPVEMTSTTVTPSTTTSTTTPPRTRKEYDPAVLAKLEAPKDSYWDKVAECETGGNWQNRGNWAGGLGIARRTWRGYGGTQFALTPDKATREQQITVANRIALYGWQTDSYYSYEDKVNNRPMFRNPVGFNGWGCIKNNPHLKPPVPPPSVGVKQLQRKENQ